MFLGEYIIKSRRKRGISQVDMALELGLSPGYWCGVENEKNNTLENPSPFLLQDIAHILDISYVDLMYRAGYMDGFPRDHRITMQENEELKIEIERLKEENNE